MAWYEFEGKRPVVHATSFVHPEATLIGDVRIGAGCYIGPGARLRADWGSIIIGPGSNIQENCVIHSRPEQPAELGPSSHIGHGAILHSPVLKEHVVVGMGAVVMDGTVIGENSLVAAGAIVLGNNNFPPGKLIAGVPAKAISDLTPEKRNELLSATKLYQGLPSRCFATLKLIEPSYSGD